MSNEVKKQDTSQTAEEKQQKLISDTVKTVMEAALPMVAAAYASGQPKPQASTRGKDYGPRCGICGQYVSGCNNEHEEVIVYPERYPEFGKYFRGYGLNGVWYLSNNENHKIPVPKASVVHVQQSIAAFEKNERETMIGRDTHHNSGSVHQPIQAQVGWR